MSEQVIAFHVRILDANDVERSDLQIVFDGERLSYRDSDGLEHQRKTLLGADFLIQPMDAARIMHQFGG